MVRFISSRIPLVALSFAAMSPLPAVVIVHDSGVTTYPDTIAPSSIVSVNGGEATFTGTIRSNVVVHVNDGTANFFGEIQNGAEFNLLGGNTLIDTVKNNATLNVAGNAQLTLVQETGNSAILNLTGAGTLILDGDNIFGNAAQLNASGGSILTQGHDFEFWEANLTGSTVIDLGGTAANISLGNMSGSGELIFTNWTNDTVINYDPSSPIDPASQIIFDGADTTFDPGIATPIPEPGHLLMLMIGAVCWIWRRNR